MWLIACLGAAGAVELQGELFGAPFTVGGALGLTDPAQPGVLSVMVTSEALTCDKAAELRGAPGGASKGKRTPPPPMVVATFHEVRPGAVAQTVLTLGPQGMGALAGPVTLSSTPGEVGSTGDLTLALAAPPAAGDGAFGAMVKSAPTDRLTGEVRFTLCTPLASRPSLAGTVFEPTPVRLSQASPFPDDPPAALDVTVPLPKGWTARQGRFGESQWAAPDGVTRLTLALQSPSEPFEASMQGWAESQVKAFSSASTSGELVGSRLAAPGTFVVRWRYRWGEGPWTHALAVFRQGPGWPHAVSCRIEGSDAVRDEVFDAAEAACAALTATGEAPAP